MDFLDEIRRNPELGAKRLVAEYGDRLFAVARRLGLNVQDAEDLVFRTLGRALGKLGTYKGESSFFTWLYAIMMNLRRMDARRLAANALLPVEEVPDQLDERPDPGEALAQISDAAALRAAIDELPDIFREVVVFRNFTLRLLGGSAFTFGGTGRLLEGDVVVGGGSDLVLDTQADVVARSVQITEGVLTIAPTASTTIGKLTFVPWQETWNTVRVRVDASTGRSGALHVTGAVDLSRTRGACEALSAERPNVLVMTSDVGFTNVDETRDANRNRLFVGTHQGLPALYFGRPFSGTCIIVR